ncbi:hypothetical protein KAFR_0A03480 [Kazachstania africana CBS 2517]|uniref:Glutamate--cysteine ligase n=1 Tax=Kazachstania africana (strain ATCC 22294 / BCRC 22015 / CBS 2517 / CECT 1963 / NBRC 1671 / NRRL Y-8276) TaxID=1071382 RepID=H2AN33_KAZAF|nr:hypothetical protein KAFR_0A03480 [Kazachstania africana CBS 2517]CCF55783.1 hypothetical protein KAFR_0A03480 [Kazachstania africana CBS 2517]
MGLLTAGTPLPWDESKQYNNHIRNEGIEQLLTIFKNTSKRDNDPLLWGDELEYMLLDIDDLKHSARLDVLHDVIITELNTIDTEVCQANDVEFHPEYGRFMIEATPKLPYTGYVKDYVEFNMKMRRKIIQMKLNQYNKSHLIPLSLTAFPGLGTKNFLNVENVWNHKNSASRSQFLPDEVINRHVRFPTLTANIRKRRGEKVCINIPMYRDSFTPDHDTTVDTPNRNWFIPEDLESSVAAKKGHIYMDAMGFGMGSSCLQTTYQAPNLEKARFLYDSLVNFAPIMLALSAASPAFKGWLADQDVRWNVISMAVDCRTPRERGVEPLLPKYNPHGMGGVDPSEHADFIIPKSRYSEVDLYLGGLNKFFNRNFNDTNVPVSETILKKLLENDKVTIDYDMAKHFAHLFIRDSVSMFEETINQSRETSMNHFENIQSTNWQTLRFKPPSPLANPDNKTLPGWRVEFRPLEVQLTDFENAAYSNFMFLVVESILESYNEKIPYIPMSKVWENMSFAHMRDVIGRKIKFNWKCNFNGETSKSNKYTLDEIFHNKENGIFETFINAILQHKGLVSKTWVELKDSTSNRRLYYYLKLISDRATGIIPTAANFIRNFILNHKDYKHDSRVPEQITYDLILLCERITNLDNSHKEIRQYFGDEIAVYLLNDKVQIE